MVRSIPFLLLLLTYVIADQKRYDDYSLYKLQPSSSEQVGFLRSFLNSSDFHVWQSAEKEDGVATVVVSPEGRENLDHQLKKRSIRSEVVLENIQEAFDAQVYSRRKRSADGQLFWTNYQTADEIYDWFYHLERTYPDVVTVVNVGRTFLGRNITGIRISRNRNRRAFVVEAGMVGADWLSPTVATYLVNQLVLGEDPEALQASQDFDWHIFPISNPDGFEYTQNVDRLWYKNRRSFSLTAVGIDLTRNWNSQWGVRGASFTPTDDTFSGLGPFSELETRQISGYIADIGSIAGLLSFRSFGQKLIIPFAHTETPMYNYDDMMVVARRAMGSLAVRYGTQYEVGTSGDIHDGATGNIIDWAKHRFNPPVVASFLLRDTGTWGYVLPVVQVEPTCEETYDGVIALVREAQNIGIL